MKKLVSLLMVCCILSGLIPFFAGAFVITTTSADGFGYQVKDGIAIVIGIPEGKKVIIPPQIDGYPVKILGMSPEEREDQPGVVWYGSSSKELVLPEGLEIINDAAFKWSNIEKISLPSTLKSIGSDVFWGTNIKTLALPASLETVGGGAFSYASKLSKLTVDKDNPHFYVKDGMLIDRRINALIACVSAKSGTAKVPDGVVMIGPYAFSGCEKLTAVTLPESVTSLGEYAFAWCYKLAKINLPSGITALPEGALMSTVLSKLALPEGLIDIGKDALSGITKLKTIMLPASLINIGDGAFSDNGLTAFEVAEGNTAFIVRDGVLFDKGITKLWGYPNQSKAKEYAVPQGVIELDHGVFSGSKNLTRVTLPEGITVIPEGAFSGNVKNKMVIDLPDTLTMIEDHTFSSTFWGDELVLPAGVRTIGRAFENASFKSLVLPEGLESIGQYSFRGNPELTKVTLPSTLREIPDGAFSGNQKLAEVVGIEHVGYVSELAFQNCPNLTLTLNNPKPGADVFSGTWRLTAVMVDVNAGPVSPDEAGVPVYIMTLNEDGTGTYAQEGQPAEDVTWVGYGSAMLEVIQSGSTLWTMYLAGDGMLVGNNDQMAVVFNR